MVRLSSVWVFLLFASPALAQDVVPDLRAARGAYPTPMSKAQLSEMLNRVAAQHPGWGLLRKDSGNNCPTPYPGVSVSCDWMVYAPTRWGYDILSDQEGAARVVESGGESLAAGTEIVYPWPTEVPQPPVVVPPPVVPPPVVVPPAQPVDLAPVLTRLDALSEQFAQADADERVRDAALAERVDHPGWFSQVFGNRYVQMALAGVGTWLGQKAAK